MKPNFIVMLTRNTVTVDNALDVFNECQDLPVDCWGFKDTGITEQGICKLVDAIKEAGKKSFLEVVTLDEASCMDAAKIAYNSGVDYLIGTMFYPSVWEYISSKQIAYFPFVGDIYVNVHPAIMKGSPESMIEKSKMFHEMNIQGINLPAYHYVDDCPEELARKVIERSKSDVIIAGNITNVSRLNFIKNLNPWGFTIGSSLFDGAFAEDAGFKANVLRACELL